MDIISPILNIVSFLCTSNGANMCYLCGLKQNKDVLKDAMEELKDTRDDVKRRVDEAEMNPNELMKRTHEVNGWLQRVQTIEGEAGEIFEKVDQEIESRCMGGYCPKKCWSARKIGKLVIQKLAIVNDLRSKGSFGDVAYKLPPSFVQKEPVDLTVGMESMFDKVWRSFAEEEVRIMGLYGYGGVGKTTLLKQINNAFLKSTTTPTTHGFDVVLFVVVSKASNVDAIRMEIGKRLGLSSSDRTSIFNALTTKNFLLLLDDIWEKVDLQSIGIPRPENKSKVIFTTRSEIVCGHMDANKKFRVECLPWDEAWTLFQEKVGNETLNSHPKVHELAEVVARECGGLPLALITIGRAMSTKKSPQEWNHAITTLHKSASEFPGMSDEVLPLLKLSYDSLRNDTIKSCFLFCALYPDDHSIYMPKLIEYWIGEGFLNEFNHLDEARNHGYDVIGILKGACLLESYEDEHACVKMHDTIRDLALWIACDCGNKRDQICVVDSFFGTSEKWYNAKRIYSRCIDSGEMKSSPPPPKSPNLRTLLFFYPSSLSFYRPQNFFQFMPLLRVLDLSYSHMETLPTSITELLELQYLSLSGSYIRVIPDELRKLVKLKFLDLSRMHYLAEIPSGVIYSLVELRFFNLHESSGVDWDIEEVYNLTHLNDLGITINTQHNTLKKLLSSSNQSLQMCTRHVHLGESNPFSSPSSRSTTILEVDSMKSLVLLLSNLETLSIHSLPPELMNMEGVWGYHSFQNISSIVIRHCNAVKDLTWVGYVTNLKTLFVHSCKELEDIVIVVDDFGRTCGVGEISNMIVVDIFKRLETLTIFDSPKLKSICSHALAFPCLVSMRIEGCRLLKKLPFDSRSNVNNTLQKIQGGRKWWSELQWEEDHDNTELVKSKFLPYFKALFFPHDGHQVFFHRVGVSLSFYNKL